MYTPTVKSLMFKIILIALFLSSLHLDAQFNQLSEADNFANQGDYESAISTLNNYIELNPSDEKAFIKRAMVYQMLGQPVDRDQDLAFAKYLNPYSNLYLSMTSRFRYIEKKKYAYNFSDNNDNFSKSPVIKSYYDKYLQGSTDIHAQDSLLNKAIISLSQNDLNSTEKVLSQIQESENIKGILYDLKGLVALKQNRISESIDLFTKAIQSKPRFPLAYHNRAVAYKLNDQLDKSKSDLLKAISLNEDISVFYFTLAKLNESLDGHDLSRDNYAMALEKNPQYLEARNNYSLIQKTLGNYEGAVKNLNIIIDNGPDESENFFFKGAIALTYGEYENAINEFDNYLDIFPDDSNALYNRGLAKILKGTKAEGCADISDSIEQVYKTDRREIYMAFCNHN